MYAIVCLSANMAWLDGTAQVVSRRETQERQLRLRQRAVLGSEVGDFLQTPESQ